jgi:diadenosine tetraphosphate (Ap4A) HIT family hydrolase
MTGACHVCAAVEAATPDGLVYDRGPWAAYAVADVPGWVMLASRRHAEGMWALDAEESSTLGEAIQAIGVAVKSETGAERIHLVYLGENALHFHMGFFPLQAGEEALFPNQGLVDHIQAHADADTARSVADRIRANL